MNCASTNHFLIRYHEWFSILFGASSSSVWKGFNLCYGREDAFVLPCSSAVKIRQQFGAAVHRNFFTINS